MCYYLSKFLTLTHVINFGNAGANWLKVVCHSNRPTAKTHHINLLTKTIFLID